MSIARSMTTYILRTNATREIPSPNGNKNTVYQYLECYVQIPLRFRAKMASFVRLMFSSRVVSEER